MIHSVWLVDTLAQLSQIFLLFSMNQCPKYMCVSSCSHYLSCEVCPFPIAKHTHQCIAIQWNLVGRCVVRDEHRIMYWYRIMYWCWKVLVIYLNKLFFIKATKAAWQDRLSKFEGLGCSKIWHSLPYQLTLPALYQLTLLGSGDENMDVFTEQVDYMPSTLNTLKADITTYI